MRSAVIGCLLLLSSCPAVSAEGTWLAVGYGGRRMISTDGLSWEITGQWEENGGDNGNNLMSAVYGNRKFVVVGGGGGGPTGAGHILVSSDGRDWKETHKDKARINPVVFGKGRFVVGASSYPSGKLMWSADAETWEAGAKIAEKGLTHFRGGEFGNGLFVLVGNGRVQSAAGESKDIHWAVATPDGEKIVSERTDLPGHGKLVFGAEQFLMLTSHADAELIASRDGSAWEKVAVADDAHFSWLVWSGREFLVGNYKQAFRSPDGKKWDKADFATNGNIVWSDGARFIASGWPGKMSFSDGKKWQPSPPLTPNGINRVIFAEGFGAKGK